jgi:hypothetical protein
MAGSHLGIAVEPRTRRREPLQLNFSGAHDSLANLGGTFRLASRPQFFVVHGRHINVDIDAIEQRAGDLAHVALNHGLGAMTFARAVIEIAALLWVTSLLNVTSRIWHFQPVLSHR